MAHADAIQSVPLPRVMDAAALEPLRDALLAALTKGPLVVDGQAVERVCANGLFLLLSAAETAAEGGRAFSLADPSPMLKAAAAQLGMSPALAALVSPLPS